MTKTRISIVNHMQSLMLNVNDAICKPKACRLKRAQITNDNKTANANAKERSEVAWKKLNKQIRIVLESNDCICIWRAIESQV